VSTKNGGIIACFGVYVNPDAASGSIQDFRRVERPG